MSIGLFVFDSRPSVVAATAGPSAAHRADGIVVDWERSGKHERQRAAIDVLGIDTQIGPRTPVDLAPIVAASTVPVLCRIDAWCNDGPDDLERAIQGGVSEIIMPMVRGVAEVEQAIEAADGRIGVGIMVETIDACEAVLSLAALPISRSYLGLMDLAIERRTPDIFTAIADGTLDRVAAAFADVPFGFGGLTLPGLGAPVPTAELAATMVRVDAAFTFLRRSFLADAAADLAGGLALVRSMTDELDRSARAVEIRR